MDPDATHSIYDWHELRQKLVNQLVDVFGLQVEKNQEWEKLNNKNETYEHVDLTFVVQTAPIMAALVVAFRAWLDRKKIQKVNIIKPGGIEISAEGITEEQIKSILTG